MVKQEDKTTPVAQEKKPNLPAWKQQLTLAQTKMLSIADAKW